MTRGRDVEQDYEMVERQSFFCSEIDLTKRGMMWDCLCGPRCFSR